MLLLSLFDCIFQVTAATSLYHQGFDEQLIKERTGHRSDDGLRAYKRTCTSLQKKVSDALQPPKPQSVEGLTTTDTPKVKVQDVAKDAGVSKNVDCPRGSEDVNESVRDQFCISIEHGSKN